jgi:hypothetical protein
VVNTHDDCLLPVTDLWEKNQNNPTICDAAAVVGIGLTPSRCITTNEPHPMRIGIIVGKRDDRTRHVPSDEAVAERIRRLRPDDDIVVYHPRKNDLEGIADALRRCDVVHVLETAAWLPQTGLSAKAPKGDGSALSSSTATRDIVGCFGPSGPCPGGSCPGRRA